MVSIHLPPTDLPGPVSMRIHEHSQGLATEGDANEMLTDWWSPGAERTLWETKFDSFQSVRDVCQMGSPGSGLSTTN